MRANLQDKSYFNFRYDGRKNKNGVIWHHFMINGIEGVVQDDDGVFPAYRLHNDNGDKIGDQQLDRIWLNKDLVEVDEAKYFFLDPLYDLYLENSVVERREKKLKRIVKDNQKDNLSLITN